MAMPISLKNTLILMSTVIFLGACGEPEDTRPGQPVKTRQTAFKEILRIFEPMGVMLRQDRYEADKFEILAERLHALRDAPWKHFGADTHYPPSKGLPAIWQQPAQFAERRDAFLQATDLLLATAHGKDESQVRAAYKAVHDSCQDCHKTFKTR
jgi:cytochrome c556